MIAEFPERDFKLVVDDRNVGNNYKVGNLTNMYRWANHDIIVVSDSDIRVGRSSLRTIAGPFQDLEVGPRNRVWTRWPRPRSCVCSSTPSIPRPMPLVPAVAMVMQSGAISLLGAGGTLFTDPDNGSGVALNSPVSSSHFSLGANLGR